MFVEVKASEIVVGEERGLNTDIQQYLALIEVKASEFVVGEKKDLNLKLSSILS